MFMEFTEWLLLTFHILSLFFRYYVRQSGLEDKLPPHYPIRRPAQHLLSQLLLIILTDDHGFITAVSNTSCGE